MNPTIKRIITGTRKYQNLAKNGNMDNGATGWNGGAADATWGSPNYCANIMATIGVAKGINQGITFIDGNKVYIAATFKLKTAISAGGYYGIRTRTSSAGNIVINSAEFDIDTIKPMSAIRTISSGDAGFYAYVYDPSALATVLFDDVIVVCLNDYGLQNKSAEWCNTNIPSNIIW